MRKKVANLRPGDVYFSTRKTLRIIISMKSMTDDLGHYFEVKCFDAVHGLIEIDLQDVWSCDVLS